MQNQEEIKEVVKSKYAEIAVAKSGSCCCGGSKVVPYTMFQDDYSGKEGYVPEADLGLGCGVPTDLAEIKKGDVVVDLGSGAGNDVFVARAVAGDKGEVIGIDFTQEMIDKANKNLDKLKFGNIRFVLGEIENIPLEANTADVVISNCVLNLVPDKTKAFAEIYRILKPGGHFCVSDIVIVGEMSEALKKSAEMYAGCVSGGLSRDAYLGIIQNTGFISTEVKRTKVIELPDDLLKKYLSPDGVLEYKSKVSGICSITVVGYKR